MIYKQLLSLCVQAPAYKLMTKFEIGRGQRWAVNFTDVDEHRKKEKKIIIKILFMYLTYIHRRVARVFGKQFSAVSDIVPQSCRSSEGGAPPVKIRQSCHALGSFNTSSRRVEPL